MRLKIEVANQEEALKNKTLKETQKKKRKKQKQKCKTARNKHEKDAGFWSSLKTADYLDSKDPGDINPASYPTSQSARVSVQPLSIMEQISKSKQSSSSESSMSTSTII